VDEQQSRWRPTREQLLWAGATVGLVLLTIAVVIGYRYDITLWDWLKLLVVPAVIAGGGIWFNRQQRERELRIARQQREQDARIAESRTQDEALQAYLDQMSAMLVPTTEQTSLYKARPGDGLSSVARARTLTVLPRLDGKRKGRVVQFLYEAGLIAKGSPVLDLQGADLSEADLESAALRGADLGKANLYGVNLIAADLSRTNLSGAYLGGAFLYGADLRGADLRGAELTRAFLSKARLDGADFRGAGLSKANLRGAEGISNEELVQQAKSYSNLHIPHRPAEFLALAGATMPDGQKYEDWPKSKGRREDKNE
jgi:Pentapeptide repeats (8 copies)